MPDLLLLTRVIEATVWNVRIAHMVGILLLRNVLLIWRVTRMRIEKHHSATAMRWLMRDQHSVMLHGSCRIRLNRTQLVVLEANVVRRMVLGKIWTLFCQGALMELRTDPSRYLR